MRPIAHRCSMIAAARILKTNSPRVISMSRYTLLRIGSVVSVAFLLSSAVAVTQNPASKMDAGAYITGSYPNLFVRNGHTERESKAKVDAAYQQLFHGDAAHQATGFDAGSNANGPLMYITDWDHHDVRTEGMSYGMMIAVQLDKKKDFDAIWNWARTFMYVGDPKHPSYGFFSWSCKTDGRANEETPAPDGEEYFAMSLLFAANRWGNGQGIFDYQKEANTLLSAMRHRRVISGPTQSGQRSVGPEMDEEHGMVLFVPGRTDKPFTDPSYHLPAFYELWARWGPAQDRAFWARAAQTSRAFFVKTSNPETGLSPSYANFDGTPRSTRHPLSAVFAYDAWRTAANWSVDWSWWRADPQEQFLSARLQRFFASRSVSGYSGIYSLDGRDLAASSKASALSPTGLVAMNAVASLAAPDSDQSRRFVEDLWEQPIPSGQDRYYDGMLYMLGLLHVSGEFRIWKPSAP
jgi:oligosaccharide reducing-end xylanase